MSRPVSAFHRADRHARYQRRRAELVIQNVTALFDYDLVPRLGVKLDGDLVSHRPGRHEEGRFFFKNFSGAFLQSIRSWIFTEDVVTDLSLSHRRAHSVGRFCNGIASEVDHKEYQLFGGGIRRERHYEINN